MLLTTKEIALKWGVSVTWVTVLCKKGRIEGAIREGNRWYIPEDAKKPEDKRSCKNAPAKARFRFIDLFAGVGGFHQAMRYLGGECVMAAEVNEECKKTYRLNYHTEEKEIRGDVREIDPTTIAPFDVLCAGFPCQPFSKAGAQRGFQDKTRGNLFYTIMDILDAHPEVKFVILENVRNLADKTENWDIITSELTQRNFYITEEPIILSPSDFGIPQIRERVYILGIRKDIRNEKILSNWQSRDRMKFDFSISEKVKLEVKATVKNTRTHHFRHEQLMTEVYNIFVLSYLLRYDDEGLSLYDLLLLCKEFMSKDARKLMRLNYVLKNVGEDRLKYMRFNRAYTDANRHIYRAEDIPKFNQNTPRGVANAEYDCILDNVQFVEDTLFIDIARSTLAGG